MEPMTVIHVTVSDVRYPSGRSEAICSANWIECLVNPTLVKYNVCTGDGRWPPRYAKGRMEARTVLKSLGMKVMRMKRTYGASDSVYGQYFVSLSLKTDTQLEGVKLFALLA